MSEPVEFIEFMSGVDVIDHKIYNPAFKKFHDECWNEYGIAISYESVKTPDGEIIEWNAFRSSKSPIPDDIWDKYLTEPRYHYQHPLSFSNYGTAAIDAYQTLHIMIYDYRMWIRQQYQK